MHANATSKFINESRGVILNTSPDNKIKVFKADITAVRKSPSSVLPAIRKIGHDDQIYREICQFCDMCLAVIWHAITFYGLKLGKEDIWLRIC